jgi:hypothetical protein
VDFQTMVVKGVSDIQVRGKGDVFNKGLTEVLTERRHHTIRLRYKHNLHPLLRKLGFEFCLFGGFTLISCKTAPAFFDLTVYPSVTTREWRNRFS